MIDSTELLLVLTYYTVIIAVSLWVSYDSSRINLVRYNTGLSYRPWILFLVMIPLWYISIPWYLIVRRRIRIGKISPMNDIEREQRKFTGLSSRKGRLGFVFIGLGIIGGVLLQALIKFTEFNFDSVITISGIAVISVMNILLIFAGSGIVFGVIISARKAGSRSRH